MCKSRIPQIIPNGCENVKHVSGMVWGSLANVRKIAVAGLVDNAIHIR